MGRRAVQRTPISPVVEPKGREQNPLRLVRPDRAESGALQPTQPADPGQKLIPGRLPASRCVDAVHDIQDELGVARRAGIDRRLHKLPPQLICGG
jgi:hypothetical protein